MKINKGISVLLASMLIGGMLVGCGSEFDSTEYLDEQGKQLIKKYAIYLNLDDNIIMEEFNDFVFDFTSKIPVEEIEEKVKEIVTQNEKETRKKISSPYTRKKVRKAKLRPVYVFTLVTVLLVSITFILLNVFLNKQKEINYVGSEIFNEYTK